MTVYTDEVNIYNTDAIAQDIQEAHDAHKAYITEVSADNGIVVAAAGKGTVNGAITTATTGWHLADVLEFIKQGVSRFWIGLKNQTDSTPTVRIGKDSGESKMELDYHSLQMVDKEGETYLHVSDLRNARGYIEEKYIGDGTSRYFEFHTSMSDLQDPDATVKVNGATITTGFSITSNMLTFDTAPASGSVIEIEYKPYDTYENELKAYTFGKRGNRKWNGEAGDSTSVSYIGRMSVAEGKGTVASGAYSHAEGNDTMARGIASHASGLGTLVLEDYQTAIGKYNRGNTYPTYPFVIGNGDGEDARSNAFAVDWNGNVEAAGKVNNHSALKTLWSGTWSSGTLKVAGISDYKMVELTFQNAATHATCFVTGSGTSAYVRGHGGYADATYVSDYFVGLDLNMNTDTLTWKACKLRKQKHADKSFDAFSNLVVTSIIGIL